MSTHEDRLRTKFRRDLPITVVGAGPGGLACAIVLARTGRRVVVREWHRHVGHRFHGDFQGIENWSDERDVIEEMHAAGVAPTFDHHPVREGIAFDAWGSAYGVASHRPLYYLVRRGGRSGNLDERLLGQAREPGPSAQRPTFGQEGAEVRRPSRRSGYVNSKLHIKNDGLSSTFRLLEAAAFHSQRNREVGVRP